MTSPTPSQPLAGIRVVDMTWMWAGPYCSLQLAHLGAEVIRLESPERPCMNRRVPPYAEEKPGLNRAGSFNEKNQGKRSVVVDLKQPAGVKIAHDLVAISDVLVENYAVGVVDRLGLGWDTVSEINPCLVMASLSGYGVDGPWAGRLAFGGPQVMASGLGSLTGYVGGGPREVGLSYGDPSAALHGAFVVQAALWQREETGRGQYIDLAQYESLIAVLPEGVLPYTMTGEQPERRGNRDLQMAPHGIYRTEGEDRWVSIAIRDEAEWLRFAQVVGGALESDPRFRTAAGRKRNEDALDERVSAWTATRDRWEITRSLQEAGLAAFPVMDMRDVAEDPHMNGRGFFTNLPHAEVGVYKQPGIPWKYSETPVEVSSAAPCMGEANEYVARTLLGRSQEEYERLLREQVLS